MALFKKLTDEEQTQKEIGIYLMDDEIVIKKFNPEYHTSYITNYRFIFHNTNKNPQILSKDDNLKKDLSFISLNKIDSVSIVNIGYEFLSIRSVGYSYTLGFSSKNKDYIDLFKELSKLTLK